MAKRTNLRYVEYENLYSWEIVEQILEKRKEQRLPTALEAVYIEFKHHAIWIDDEIGTHKAVMDGHYGVQAVKSGRYGLVLVDKEQDCK